MTGPSGRRRRCSRSIVAALLPLAGLPLAASGGSDLLTGTALAADPDSGLQATIRRTSHGIPHITANDYGGLGFGYGYAFAQDNFCVLADIYVTVNGERSRYSGSSPLGSMGPDGSWSQGGNGTAPNNLNSDFFYQRIKDRGTVENLLAQPPPHGPLPELKEGVRGFVARLQQVPARDGRRQPARRAAAASPGCARSPRWTPTGASTSSA